MGSCIPPIAGNLIRIFICIKLPDDHINAMGRWLADKRSIPGVKWVAPKTIHITLKFCGEILPEMIEAMATLLNKENLGGPLELSVSGIGGFPNLRAPHTIWTGICGDVEGLKKLQKKAENCACRSGVERDWRKFSPHITLGRRHARGPMPKEYLDIIERDQISLPAWKAQEIIVMKSELTRSGPIYTPLKRFSL